MPEGRSIEKRNGPAGGEARRRMSAVERIHGFDKFGVVLGLERMEELLRRLGDPHRGQRFIHVAGTNGKGSVCKYLEMALRGCGYKVGLFTSPYIERFNERIRFDGEDISDEELEETAWRVIEAAEGMVRDGLASPTEFEVVTAIAFCYYREKKAELSILEVGMGGIGDSTNVIETPLISVITTISYDHMNVLGSTLAEIAENKAGIIKKGCPVVSNVGTREAAVVIARKAYETGARLYDISRLRTAVAEESPLGQTVSMELFGRSYGELRIPMTGPHQAENLKTAMAALEILRQKGEVKLTWEGLRRGLSEAAQPGRFEVLSPAGQAPTIVIDGAHNEAGAAALAQTMKDCFDGRRILLVTGILADKDVDAILQHFVRISREILVTEPENPRRMKAEELAGRLEALGIRCRQEPEVESCVEAALELGADYDVVLFCGSLYLVGRVRTLIRERLDSGH